MLKMKQLPQLLAILLTITLISCSDDDNVVNEDPPTEQFKQDGFVLSVQTPSGSALVKYFEELPTTETDASENATDFQQFFPVDLFDGAMYLPRPSGDAGFSKFQVNEDGSLVETATFPTVDERSFRIKVKDASTAVLQDRNNPTQITVVDPADLSIKTTIDMSQGEAPFPQRYQTFYFRDNLVFAPIFGNDGNPYDKTIVHIADVESGSFVSDAVFNGLPSKPAADFGSRTVAEDGTIYFPNEAAIEQGNGLYSIRKIPGGSNEFDENYNFRPGLVVNPNNQILPAFRGFKYIGDGRALAIVATSIPQALLDLLAQVGGDPSNLSQQQVQQALGILFQAENGKWSVLDLEAQTVSPIQGIPDLSPFASTVTITEDQGDFLLPVTGQNENAYYRFDPTTNSAQKEFDVNGGEIIGLFNLSVNN